MTSPATSLRSLPSSSRSVSPAHSASTAPSTPDDAPASYILITHAASATFLHSLPVRKSSHDRILHFAGTGNIKALLARAAEVLEDRELSVASNWESVKSTDNDKAITYWCSKSVASSLAIAPSTTVPDFDKLDVDSNEVRVSCYHTQISFLTLL